MIVFFAGIECYYIFLENWEKMEIVEGIIFVFIFILLDLGLVLEGYYIVYIFIFSYIENW